MLVYLVRHGETDWNKEKKFQGHADIPLNEKGLQQAERASFYLANKNISAVYSSDLMRASKTGEIIARLHGLQVIKDQRLREINFGVWEGLDFNNIYTQYRKEFDEWYRDTFNSTIPGGDSIKKVLQNILSFFEDLSKEGWQEVVVATHGGVIKSLLWHIKRERGALWDRGIPPGSITILNLEKNRDKIAIVEENIIP